MAKPWQVLSGSETYERAKDVIEAQPVEPLKVKGKQDLIHAYEVADFTGNRDSFVVHHVATTADLPDAGAAGDMAAKKAMMAQQQAAAASEQVSADERTMLLKKQMMK